MIIWIRNRIGLTLVELLIIVAVLGILAAILVPQLLQYFNLRVTL